MGETGGISVLNGGERETNDRLSFSHYVLKAPTYSSHTAGEDVLCYLSEEGTHDESVHFVLSSAL